MQKIKIDISYPELQKEIQELQKQELALFISAMEKMKQLSWSQLYKHKGLRWEAITSKKTYDGNQIYSFRFSKKYRALALRRDVYLIVLSIHLDHDSAYN